MGAEHGVDLPAFRRRLAQGGARGILPAGVSVSRGARSSNDTPIACSSSRTCVSIADGAAPMIVVTD